jgi:hypothetical protein
MQWCPAVPGPAQSEPAQAAPEEAATAIEPGSIEPIEIEAPPPPAIAELTQPTYRPAPAFDQVARAEAVIARGHRGLEVRELQQWLVLDGAKIAVDGLFGADTERALRSYQRRHGLAADGVLGPKTWADLDRRYGRLEPQIADQALGQAADLGAEDRAYLTRLVSDLRFTALPSTRQSRVLSLLGEAGDLLYRQDIVRVALDSGFAQLDTPTAHAALFALSLGAGDASARGVVVRLVEGDAFARLASSEQRKVLRRAVDPKAKIKLSAEGQAALLFATRTVEAKVEQERRRRAG